MNLDEETMRYTGDEPFKNVEDARTFLDRYINNSDSQYKRGFGRMTALRKSDGVFLGFVGLKDVDGIIDLGYRLKKKHWGQGYGTELARAMIKHAFEILKLGEVIANVHEENIGSQQVAERCGMQIAYRFLWDDRLPGRYYKITRDEYRDSVS
jgi:RimJ/RimL family protein N-acetyltransferase